MSHSSTHISLLMRDERGTVGSGDTEQHMALYSIEARNELPEDANAPMASASLAGTKWIGSFDFHSHGHGRRRQVAGVLCHTSANR
jgi:hypothetical protein